MEIISKMDPLAPYLDTLSHISWYIPAGGDLVAIFVRSQRTGQETPITNSELYNEFSLSLPIGPFRMYYRPNTGSAPVGREYPGQMSILQILGAIATYYSEPIPERDRTCLFSYHRSNPVMIELRDKLRRGGTVTNGEILSTETNTYFNGLRWSSQLGGYEILLTH